MAETSQPSNNSEISNSKQSSPSALPLQNAFAELESSLPPLLEGERTYHPPEPINLNQGMTPMDANSQATSLALASNMSTPVPAHVDRLPWTRPLVSEPALVPIPVVTNQPELRTRTPVLNENSQENQGLSTGEEPYIPPSAIATTMLDQQWNLFQRARQARNVPLMRTALQQAISTQELLTNLVGHEEMLRVSLQWIARDEMNLLEQSVQNDAMQLSTTPASSPTVPMVMSTPHLPGMNNTAPVPNTNAIRHVQRQNMRRPTPEITYLGRTHSATRVPLTPTSTTVDSSAYYTPGVPESARRYQTGHDSPKLPWSKPRSRMETTRQHYENGAHGRVFRQSGESPWSHEQSAKIQPRTTKPPLSTISESPPLTSPLDDHKVPSAQSASDPSSTEEFFNNINSQFIPDTTFLLEDKIRDLFSTFISDLPKHLNTVPSHLVESCVSKFESIVHKNLNEMLTAEIIPSLISEVLHHVEKNNMDRENIVSMKDEIAPLKDFIKENIECVQDIIHVNDSQMQANIEQVRHDIKELNQKQEHQTSYLAGLINELNNNENTRFEQIKRRLGDMTQNVNILNNKLNSHSASEHLKDPPPHLHYNNPFLNQTYIPPPDSQEIPSHFQQAREAPPTVSPKQEPEWKILFPFIKHDIDNDVRKELWKSIPKTHEWEKFSGELPYNHELWLQNVDVFVKDYYLLDHMIISRLTSILTDTAKNWYLGLRINHGDKSWAWWKNAIRNKFGTDHWR
ncbi:hypothetical protein Pst134EB_028790 [Puccinia striiformis f. sp. tritici]|nr:hypothetical protein Pst134EB_028790 [Puccinia striiformis f. sp. tritici]